MELSSSCKDRSNQGSQDRVPACRIARSYVLSPPKRATTLIWVVFAIFMIRIEFLQQKRKGKTYWALRIGSGQNKRRLRRRKTLYKGRCNQGFATLVFCFCGGAPWERRGLSQIRLNL
ncbi:hypothetical protein MtrunA17_Chr2g0286201 [Medicago truncatula]|uniref:Transmembrane protein, putative n=1 Tax=Medicago truncatula TaxID=3880 RepID=G7IPZ6_MEDTR|nr:transmembrane protein, putative [Medicago truncatula]RHN72302.1 hypothetical protein MtrunA17_Chr2g0286201 [Medicago truncatula]